MKFACLLKLNVNQKRKEEKEKGETTDEDLRFRKVKDSYTDVEDYISTYEPLLFEEVKSLISKDKDQCNAISFFFYVLIFANFRHDFVLVCFVFCLFCFGQGSRQDNNANKTRGFTTANA